MTAAQHFIPEHIAIIMDGNGRWAKERGLDRSLGHQEGVETVTRITTTASNLGVKFLTLYTFSTENWNRPAAEVTALMGLILTSLHEELFVKNNVRLRLIGDMTALPQEVLVSLLRMQELTAHHSGMTMVLAINYSARWELTEATKRIAKRAMGGQITTEEITPELISSELSTSFMPDPDLLIRTGGEQRLSNYLLWQSAYTEFYFTPVYWPDFSNEEFAKAIDAFAARQRRFGLTGDQVINDNSDNK